MNPEFLAKLTAAQTDDERSWLVTELRLGMLSEELRSVVWATAVPHWFDAEILAALRPELADQAASLYLKIQGLSFIEQFCDRGHRVHDLTRKLMLDQLWLENPTEFKLLSHRAAAYFRTQPAAESQIELVYHQVGHDSDLGASALNDLAWNWYGEFRRPEYELLLRTIQEHVDGGRGTHRLMTEIVLADVRLRLAHEQFVLVREKRQQILILRGLSHQIEVINPELTQLREARVKILALRQWTQQERQVARQVMMDKIVQHVNDGTYVDIRGKVAVLLPIAEATLKAVIDLSPTLAVDKSFSVFTLICEQNEEKKVTIFHRQMLLEQIWEDLAEQVERNATLNVCVTGSNRGSVTIVLSLRGFIPRSHVSTVGQIVQTLIDEAHGRISFSSQVAISTNGLELSLREVLEELGELDLLHEFRQPH
jgi:hypothetical protein